MIRTEKRLRPFVCSSLGLAILAAAVMQVGCVGSRRPKSTARQSATTQTATNAAEHDRNVEQLQQDFEKDRSAGNQIRLSEAETQAADAHVALARQCRADHRPRDARRELTTALADMPAHPQAITMAREVDRDIAQADSLVHQATVAWNKKDEVAALRLAEQVLALDRNDATARQIVNDTRGATLQSVLQQAAQALDQRQWDAAAGAAAKVRLIDPANSQAKDIEKKAIDRKRTMQLVESSRAAAAKGDDAAAIKPLAEAASLWPDNKELSAERDRVTLEAIDRHLAKGDAECQAGRFTAGMTEFDQALAIAPGNPKTMQHRQQAIAKRLDSLQEIYEQQALAGKWELAWPAAVHLATLRPADEPGSLQDMARAEEMIRQRITCRLRVIRLPSSGTAGVNTLAVARTLADELERIKPAHYRLLPLETTADALAKTSLSLADIGDPNKLKSLDPDLAPSDLLLFVDVTSREFAMQQPAPAQPTGQQPAAAGQAQVDYQQAKEELGRARQLALADERKWDGEARHALNADETFLPKAAAGVYGLLAQRAAEDYNAALRRLQQTPGAAQSTARSTSADGESKPALQLGVRLRLVQASTGRLLWTDDEIDTKVSDVVPPVAPTTQPAGGSAELQAAAVRQVVPMLQNKARELLTRRSLAYLEDAQKAKADEVTQLYVRFLFDLSSDPGPFVVAPAIDEVFSKQATGTELETCRKLAAQRLKLRLGPAATMPAPAAAAAGPVPPAVPAAPAAPSAPRVAAAPSPASARPAPRPAPAPTITTPNRPPSRPPAPAAPTEPLLVTPTSVVVFDGYMSRSDKRYPKERTLIDGIKILLKDTDAKPLDTDLQITVGKFSGKFKALLVGSRLRIRGQTGQEYHLTILGIEHDTHTVRLSLERPSVQPR